MEITDTHCHLDEEGFGAELEEVIARARAAGVSRMISVGSGRDMASARSAVALAERHPFIWATVGVHPHDVARMAPGDWDELERLCEHPRVRGVGETGLDYHYDHSPREAQREALVRFAEMARRRALPLVVHVREAHADCIELLEASGLREGVIHCFTGGPEEATRYLDLGFHISFSGIVTFKNARPIQEAAQRVPEDRILVETDAPYLAPVPLRGRRNEPAFVVHTVARLAELRAETPQTVAQASARNATRLFRLDSELDTGPESD